MPRSRLAWFWPPQAPQPCSFDGQALPCGTWCGRWPWAACCACRCYQPTPEQLAAVLNGGTIITAAGTTVTLAGILAQRQSGMGWGAIANAMGVKLGAVVSASKSNRPVSEFRAMNAQGRKTNVAATKTASGSADHGKSGQSNGHSGGQSGSHGNSGNSGGNSGGSGGGGGGGGRGK